MRKWLAGVFACVLAAFGLAGCMGLDYGDFGDFSDFSQFGGYGNSIYAPTVDLDTAYGQLSTKGTWTVLLYMCGSDLESNGGLATSNLQELLDAGLSDNVNMIVETGGARTWKNNVVAARSLERYRVSARGMERLATLGQASMGDAATLADFLAWGAKAYPADHYMAVFWDHGGGSLSGVCFDELHADRTGYNVDSLTLSEVKEGVAAAGVNFDVIGFDTCLMATLELAETLAPYGDYLVASEESEPGGGWDYEAWAGWLSRYPGMDGATLGRGICDSYFAKCQASWVSGQATLSVVDLSKVQALSAEFADVSRDIARSTADASRLRQLVQGAKAAESYGGNNAYEGYTDMVDLGDLMLQTKATLGNEAQDVLNALDAAVVYNVHGRERSHAQGLSVFYPLKLDAQIYESYKPIASNEPYLQYCSVLLGTYDKQKWTRDVFAADEVPVDQSDANVRFTQQVDDKTARLALSVTGGLEYVDSVSFVLGLFDENSGEYLYLGSDNNLEGSYETGRFTDNFEGAWMFVDGNVVCAELIEQNDDYNLYSIPVLVNDEETYLRAAYYYDEGAYEILGLYDGIDDVTGLSGKSMRALQEGDEVIFMFSSTDLLGTGAGEAEYGSGSVVWHDGVEMADDWLPDGIYLYMYHITDVFGNEYLTDPAIMRYSGGTVSVQEF